MILKVCPFCRTGNEPSVEMCSGCGEDISGVTICRGNAPGPEEAARENSGEELVVLAFSEGRTIEVRDGDVLGRTAVGREVLEIHEEISRRHAQFVRDEGTWFVMDLNSSNGTFLDGQRIPPRRKIPIRSGQRIMLSPVFQADVRISGPAVGTVVRSSGYDELEGIENHRKIMVVLFADLKGSVDFFQEKGTVVARNWIVNLYRMLSSIIKSHRGVHIKNIGDAILAVFDDPLEAGKAAARMQADLREHNRNVDETSRYYLRIGMNVGPVLFDDRDIFGNAVNIASRVQALAPPERVFVTEHLYEAIRDDKDIRCRFVGLEQLKGVKGKTGIYEILCDDEREADGISKPPEEDL